MKEAKSMYRGGEIIAASECDYSTAKDLGLLCPFCSSAVFIRSESVREKNGRLQLVSPYFAHYPSGTIDNWDCEKRSRSKQGREEIEQIKIQARNQRLRLYNAHLWRMIVNSHGISHAHLNHVRSQFGEAWCEQTSVLVRHEWQRGISDVYTFIDAAAQDIAQVAEYSEHFLLICDRRLHLAISHEVADFLATNTAGFVFHKLFKLSIGQQLNVAKDWNAAKIRQLSPIVHVSSISILVAATHWIEQINQHKEGV